MRIVIDGRMAQYNRTGIGAYIYNLVKALARQTEIEIVVLTSAKLGRGGLDEFRAVQVIPCAPTYGSYVYREYWEQILLPNILTKYSADVYHSPNYNLPFVVPSKVAMVVTQYDASLFATPQYYKFVHRIEGRFMIHRSAIAADRIIYGSQHAKSEFGRFFGQDLVKKGRSIYIGLPGDIEEHLNCSNNDIDTICCKYDLKRPYIVAVGSVHPRKNYERLIQSMSADQLRGFDLVICGSIAWKSKGVFDEINNRGLQNRVKITGFLETKDMVALVKGASLMVFPSYYEGFGIPPLEAFAIGTPVCASNASSIPEVVGDAALLFDPFSSDDLISSIVKVSSDEQLRENLIQNGRGRLNYFSWDQCAAEHIEVYKEALIARSGRV